MLGVVLSGGGARGAYQAGVLSAVAEICAKLGMTHPFKVYTGVSAGAINASFLAAHADNFITGSEKLVQLWSQLTTDQVFKGDPLSLGGLGFKWVRDLSLGGMTGMTPPKSLLDTQPLRKLFAEHMPFDRIDQQIAKGHLEALAITAVDYYTSMAVTFVQGQNHTTDWVRSRRYSEKTKIGVEHVMASSAIPLLFPSVKVDERHFGDGCLRNLAPMSPAIHLGADKLIVVGVRRQTDVQKSLQIQKHKDPSVARVANVLLNAILLDGIELDVDRLKKINEFVERIPEHLRDSMNFKTIEHVWIHPSIDIGQLAYENARKLPRFVRYLLRGLGDTEDAKEIISYLLFDVDFCKELIDAGYHDGLKQENEIIHLLTKATT